MLAFFCSLATGIMVMSVESADIDEGSEPVACSPGAALEVIPKDDWMEEEVIMGFRVWQLMFLALAGLITVVVLLCCFMKCRVPRTKQEIEADFKRKEITRRFRFLLDRVQIEDTSLRTAIEKVNELYTNREKMKRRKRKKLEDEEEIVSMGSSYLFVDEKLTIKERVKKLLGMVEEENGSETDSMKETTDKSEDPLKRSTSLSSLPEVKIIDARQESEESSDSPKADNSKLSSPARTHDTLSRISLLQDSPPRYDVSLLQDTPPSQFRRGDHFNKSESQESAESTGSKRPQLLKQKAAAEDVSSRRGVKSDSQDSANSKYGKKSDSQDSNESCDTPTSKGGRRVFEPKESKLTRRESVGQAAEYKWRKSPSSKLKDESKITKSLDIIASP